MPMCLVTVGYDPVEYDPRLWNSDPARTLIHIDEVPADIDNHYQPALELRGDIAATLTGLIRPLTGLRLNDGVSVRIAEQRAALLNIDEEARSRPQTDIGLNPAAVVLKIRDLIDDDRHRGLRRGIALHLHGQAFPGLSASATAVLRRPADPWCRVALGDGRRPGAAGYTRSCRCPATVDSSSVHRNWRPRRDWA